jgi:hypothetical protein
MQEFIHRQNLKNYRALMAHTSDEPMRARLARLIADEEKIDRDGKDHEPTAIVR